MIFVDPANGQSKYVAIDINKSSRPLINQSILSFISIRYVSPEGSSVEFGQGWNQGKIKDIF